MELKEKGTIFKKIKHKAQTCNKYILIKLILCKK